MSIQWLIAALVNTTIEYFIESIMHKTNFLLTIVCIFIISCQQNRTRQVRVVGPAPDSQEPVKIIFDTDIGPDYDDAGALAMLHAFADNGEADILATMASNQHDLVAPVISLINTYFGRPNIPIGVPKDTSSVNITSSNDWPEIILTQYPYSIPSNTEAPDAIPLYREILSQEADQSVTIVTVGFLTNMANLLKSGPDAYSTLGGKELVQQKVNKLVVMGGKFPEGMEFNFQLDSSATQNLVENWPTQIIFSGFEIGEKILTGDKLVTRDFENNPIKDIYQYNFEKEDADARMSWDQTAVLVAVRGVYPYFDLKPGYCLVDENGFNHWADSTLRHRYLIKKMPFQAVEDTIEKYMMHQPLLR